MGVDGIGRGGGRPIPGLGAPDAPAMAPEVAGPTGAGGIGGTEVVSTPGAAEGVAAAGPLGQLQRGEITLDQYLDLRVADAVGPYVGKVPESQLAFIRESLRDVLASDPVVIELVRRTTGAIPAATE